MRRTTAAAVGTMTGAALIMAVRLSAATAPLATAEPPAFDLTEAGATQQPAATPTATPGGRSGGQRTAPSTAPSRDRAGAVPAGDLRDGRFTGRPSTNQYGTIQVAVAISGGRVTGTAVSYPRTGQSATINAAAVPKLKEQTLQAQSAKIDTVSGATYTSQSYVESLQAALDAAGG